MENGSWAVLGRSGGCRRDLLDSWQVAHLNSWTTPGRARRRVPPPSETSLIGQRGGHHATFGGATEWSSVGMRRVPALRVTPNICGPVNAVKGELRVVMARHATVGQDTLGPGRYRHILG